MVPTSEGPSYNDPQSELAIDLEETRDDDAERLAQRMFDDWP
jgi:hypothetical protein